MKRPVVIFFATCVMAVGAHSGRAPFFTSGPQTENRIALSFDDGPGPQTEAFLALLDERGVKATFFMLGEQAKRRPALAKKVADAGHEVASHTWNHVNYKAAFRDQANQVGAEQAERDLRAALKEDLQRSADAIEKATGVRPHLLRMPHGIDRPWISDVAGEGGYTLVNWTFGADWESEDLDALAMRYEAAIKPGAILLFHDGGSRRDRTLALVERVLAAAKSRQFDVVPVGTIIGLSPDSEERAAR